MAVASLVRCDEWVYAQDAQAVNLLGRAVARVGGRLPGHFACVADGLACSTMLTACSLRRAQDDAWWVAWAARMIWHSLSTTVWQL